MKKSALALLLVGVSLIPHWNQMELDTNYLGTLVELASILEEIKQLRKKMGPPTSEEFLIDEMGKELAVVEKEV